MRVYNDFLQAVANNDVRTVVEMMPQTDPKNNDSLALWTAANHGHAAVVRILLQHCDDRAQNSAALHVAAMNGHTECVKVLCAMSDPKSAGSKALVEAAAHGHECIVNLLWDVSDPSEALLRLEQDYPTEPQKWRALKQRWAAEQQQKTLTQHVCSQKAVMRSPQKI